MDDTNTLNKSETEMRRDQIMTALALVAQKVRNDDFAAANYWLDSVRIFVNALAREVQDD